jgi:LppP/LprE lipoprotein
VLPLLLGILSAFAVMGTAMADTSWLDQPPKAWNIAGAAAPTAPAISSGVQAICRTREVAASGPEEAQVAAAGWLIEDYWKIQRQGKVVPVLANSDYDGMCRPWGFNGFVFVDGHFAGTISPVNMNSRDDGVLQTAPTLMSGGVLQATFLRYTAKDPRCCPALPPTRVTCKIAETGSSQILLQVTIGQVSLPVGLPKAGEPLPFILPVLIAGSILLTAGVLLRSGGSIVAP